MERGNAGILLRPGRTPWVTFWKKTTTHGGNLPGRIIAMIREHPNIMGL